MNINKIPTGYLFTDTYSKGELETLSIGDYGKKYNIKADFLGFTKEIHGVPNIDCMPLSEKWVMTLSTQYGCLSSCTFCDVPKINYLGNATFDDLYSQFKSARSLFENVKYTERLNIHFARMGEPTYNKNVLDFTNFLIREKEKVQNDLSLRTEVIHPVLTSMMPRNHKKLSEVLLEWIHIKNVFYKGQAGIQLSINSTNDSQRDQMFKGLSLSLDEISKIGKSFSNPVSRKYCLNFCLASDFEVDPIKLRDLFDPSKFMVKITPIHNNDACRENNIQTKDGYHSYLPYKEAEEGLKKVGFDVLVFVPSLDEEDGLVTCGNLILGGSKLKKEVSEHKIQGV
jgi:23S rRNA (adenine2503-C2)-methyltransferase